MFDSVLTIIPVLFPVLTGAGLLTFRFKERKTLYQWVAGIVIVNAVAALILIFTHEADPFVLFSFTDTLEFVFRVDSLSAFFGTMVSLLWVLTTFYAFEYMKHEGHEQRFFAFFIMAFGVVLGLAFAGNMFTLYVFYEFLTLSTIPLVMHAMDGKARHAGKTYIIYMMAGASLAFIGFIFICMYGGNELFTLGGTLDPALVKGNEELLRFVFLLTFLGFGVKAALFPFSHWLPAASVAPTPVTALLHAVAVVKSGIFAMIRLTYFSFGTELIQGSWEQSLLLVLAMITILYGSIMALRTPHIKRRFAYSTISNLSYIIFGLLLCTPQGMAAALLHLIYHALIKITLFFAAGAILYKTHKEYIYEIGGLARKMPIVFGCMAVASLGLIGVPPFAGFFSKWALATAAVDSGNPLAYVGVLVLILSALLTALYCISLLVKAYFPPKGEQAEGHDPNWLMCGPLLILSAASMLVAFYPQPLLHAINLIAGIS